MLNPGVLCGSMNMQKQQGRRAPGRRTVIPANLPNSLHRRPPAPEHYPIPGPDEVLICPLGGVGRIGMNWTLYGHAGKWMLVDAGISFVRDVPGVEMLMPDPDMLSPILRNLRGLVVTHAHEDHIGGIVHLASSLGRTVPIYATPFAAAVIKGRLAEARIRATVRTFRPGEMFQLDPFRLASIPVAHSVPEAVAFAIGTRAGIVVHTGDWKIDKAPVVGHRTSMKAFERLGERGVLAVLADSTNSQREADIPTESEIALNMERTIMRRKGLIVASCFATNIDRIAGIVRAAKASNRVVALAGRSMLRNEEAARAAGIFGDDVRILTDSKLLLSYERERAVLVCTGTQGEENSALDRMAFDGARHLPKIRNGDTIIHSARAIPGRELEIRSMFAALRAKGAEILEAKDEDGNPLHASGHATRSDIQQLHGLLRPRFVIPVHGEPDHLGAHADLAMAAGAEAAPILAEGNMISVSQAGWKLLTHITPRLIAGHRTPDNRMNLFPVKEEDLVPVVDRTQRAGYEQSMKIAV